jgi:hypothetical protein
MRKKCQIICRKLANIENAENNYHNIIKHKQKIQLRLMLPLTVWELMLARMVPQYVAALPWSVGMMMAALAPEVAQDVP